MTSSFSSILSQNFTSISLKPLKLAKIQRLFGVLEIPWITYFLLGSVLFSLFFPVILATFFLWGIMNPMTVPVMTRQPSVLETKSPTRVMRIVATAYSSTPDQTDDSPFITANGMYVYDGLVAANYLPFGTKIKIPELFGDKVFTVNDRMNARYGQGRIDIWMTTRQEAKQFGVRSLKAEIYQ